MTLSFLSSCSISHPTAITLSICDMINGMTNEIEIQQG